MRQIKNRNLKKRKKTGKKSNFWLTFVLVAITALTLFASSQMRGNSICETIQPIKEKVSTTISSAKKEVVAEVQNFKNSSSSTPSRSTQPSSTHISSAPQKSYKNIEIPLISDSSLFYHNTQGRYCLQYSPTNKVADWVAHCLTRKEVKTNGCERQKSFKTDTYFAKIGYLTATDKDYKKSGYDRGHMVPSADRDDSVLENKATFLFSNIAPQMPNLNRKTINMTERTIRSWALKYDSLYIVTGTIFDPSKPRRTIGKGVGVPSYFYKTVAAKINGQYQMVAFLYPNSNELGTDIKPFICTVDEIERRAKVDLYHALPDNIEAAAEATVNKKLWN